MAVAIQRARSGFDATHLSITLRVTRHTHTPAAPDRHNALLTSLGIPLQPEPPSGLFINGSMIERVDSFVYLGYLLSTTATTRANPAVLARLSAAASTLAALRPTLRKCSKATNLTAWRAIAKAQITYSAQAWSLTQADRNALDTFQQRWLRRLCLLLPKTDPVSGLLRFPRAADVLKAADEPLLSDQVDRIRLRYYGHILRRGPTDTRWIALHSTMPLRGRDGVNSTANYASQLASLMEQAEVSREDAMDRTLWHGQITKWLASRKKLASSALVDPPA